MSTIRVRKLDSNHDMIYGQGSQDYLIDIDAVSQIIQTRLLLFLREWWEDREDGLPLWQRILGRPGIKKGIIDGLIRERILGTPYVKGIQSLTSKIDVDLRSYQVYIVVQTSFGPVIVTNITGG